MKTLNILDIPLSQITAEEAVNEFLKLAQDVEKKHFVATPNAEILLKAQTDLDLKKFLQYYISGYEDYEFSKDNSVDYSDMLLIFKSKYNSKCFKI